MTQPALQRIKEIEKEDLKYRHVEFLLKAFNVMREMAIYYAIDVQNEFPNTEETINMGFEERMSK